VAGHERQRHLAAVAEPEDVRLVDAEVREEPRDVVRRVLERERPVDARRVPVALLLDRDHPA
jgi:hypothetical protein